MDEWLTELASFFLELGLVRLREKNRVLYALVMGGIAALMGGIASLFYSQGAPVRGTVMALFALLLLALLFLTLRRDPKPTRRSWNSWFDKNRRL